MRTPEPEVGGGATAGPPMSGDGSEGGFTLIEVIAALVIFSIGILSTTALTTALSIQMRDSAIRSEVVAETQQHLEALSVLPFAALDTVASVDTFQIQGYSYLRTVEVEDIDRLKRIRVSLDRIGAGGASFDASAYVVRPW